MCTLKSANLKTLIFVLNLQYWISLLHRYDHAPAQIYFFLETSPKQLSLVTYLEAIE